MVSIFFFLGGGVEEKIFSDEDPIEDLLKSLPLGIGRDNKLGLKLTQADMARSFRLHFPRNFTLRKAA